MKIEIFDPAMCCASGICGPSVDPELVRIQEAVRQIRKQAPEVQVARYGLASEPQAFVANGQVAELLKNEGPEGLPLVFVDGTLLCKGRYPANGELETVLRQAGFEVSLAGDGQKSPCSCVTGCC